MLRCAVTARLASASSASAASASSIVCTAAVASSLTATRSSRTGLLRAWTIASTPMRGIATASAPGGDRHKGARAKQAGGVAEDSSSTSASADVDGDVEVVTPDAAAAAAAKKAARAAKKAAASAALSSLKSSERAERRAKKDAQKAASDRAELKFKASVIEKEVPLMDLTGIKPGQNMFTNVLSLMREEKFPSDVIQDLTAIGDYATGSTADILSGRLANLAEKYGRKPYDTGSPEVQVAMLTERLKGYDRHMVEHKADINSRRGFLAAWHRRRKLLKYLRRTKYETYAYMMKELQLREADIDSVGLDRTSGTQAARIKRD